MDETQEFLRKILGRLDEMSADMKAIGLALTGQSAKTGGLQSEVKEIRNCANERLEKLEGRMDYLAAK